MKDVNRLKRVRLQAGLTQSEVARATGVNVVYYNRIETGTIMPGPRTQQILCRFFSLSPEGLFMKPKKDVNGSPENGQ